MLVNPTILMEYLIKNGLGVTQRSSTSSGQLSKVDGYMLREAGGDHFSVDLMITV